jgi:hypothetical protein
MKIYLLLLILWFQSLCAQTFTISKIEPPNWWTGMKWDTLQLMIYGDNLQEITASIEDTCLIVTRMHVSSGGRYAFIDIHVRKDLEPGAYIINLQNNNSKKQVSYIFMERNNPDGCYQGFNETDIIYLITPDRFVNGDLSNDHLNGMRDKKDPKDILGRRGGDISGILGKLTYLKDLGITTIWINPLVENDMEISYHGYGATNLYLIDPRFGNNEHYQELVRNAHLNGIKVIMDHVSNHIGIHHPWVTDKPAEDWFNGSVKTT